MGYVEQMQIKQNAFEQRQLLDRKTEKEENRRVCAAERAEDRATSNRSFYLAMIALFVSFIFSFLGLVATIAINRDKLAPVDSTKQATPAIANPAAEMDAQPVALPPKP